MFCGSSARLMVRIMLAALLPVLVTKIHLVQAHPAFPGAGAFKRQRTRASLWFSSSAMFASLSADLSAAIV